MQQQNYAEINEFRTEVETKIFVPGIVGKGRFEKLLFSTLGHPKSKSE